MFCNKKCDGEYDGIIHQFALSSLAVRTHHITTQHNIDWVFQIVSGVGDGKKKRTQTDVNIARGALTKEPATAQKATAKIQMPKPGRRTLSKDTSRTKASHCELSSFILSSNLRYSSS